MNNEQNSNQNNNQIVPLFFENMPVRVIVDEFGEPWWVAKDVCDILEHTNYRMAVQGLDDDERGLRKVYTLGGEQEMIVINESGVYTMIIRSNKPQAKPFRKWVTSEVLPSIRKTGGYAIPGIDQNELLLKVMEGTVVESMRCLAIAIGEMRHDMKHMLADKNGFPAQITHPADCFFDTEHVGSFVEEECRLSPLAIASKKLIFASYTKWCGENGEVPYDYNTFFKVLYRLGLPVRKGERKMTRTSDRIKVVRGILVKAAEVN